MTGIFLILLGSIACIIGFVFLFFEKIRTTGVLIFGISIITVIMGFRSCKNGSFIYPSHQQLMDEEQAEQEQTMAWSETVTSSSEEDANTLILSEIDSIKNKLVGDSSTIYEKCTIDLTDKVQLFNKELVNGMNSKNKANHPFKSFNFKKLYRFINQKNWINNTKYIVPIGNQLVHISGALSNDSNCVVYEGFLNLSSRTIYWTRFQPEEIIITDFNNYSRYESPSKFLDLTQASKELRVNLIYWQAQLHSQFLTKQFYLRKDQQINSVQVDGEFIPFYKVNQIKGSGEIILREIYNY